MDLKKQENENDEQFIWRICQYKDSGMLDVSWDDVADIINKELGMEDSPFTEAAFRKPYQQAKRFYDAGVFNEDAKDNYLSELRLQRQELEKEKVKVRDERNELRRMLREEARKESYVDLIKRTISESIVEPLLYEPKDIEVNNNNEQPEQSQENAGEQNQENLQESGEQQVQDQGGEEQPQEQQEGQESM